MKNYILLNENWDWFTSALKEYLLVMYAPLLGNMSDQKKELLCVLYEVISLIASSSIVDAIW